MALTAEADRLEMEAWRAWREPRRGGRWIELLGVAMVAAASIVGGVIWQSSGGFYPSRANLATVPLPGPGGTMIWNLPSWTDHLRLLPQRRLLELGTASGLIAVLGLVAVMRWWGRRDTHLMLGELHLTPTRPSDWVLARFRPLRTLLVGATIPMPLALILVNFTAAPLGLHYLVSWDWVVLAGINTLLAAWIDVPALLWIALMTRRVHWILIASLPWVSLRAFGLLGLGIWFPMFQEERILVPVLTLIVGVQVLVGVAVPVVLPKMIDRVAECLASASHNRGPAN